ncbi:unnamed protein product [Prorocentrum cordatum]|uniref:Uncharacterized protein n=1 Tax=Prorocentrum cordatum TaxID=2364126 RepID=A0ABN9ST60_9DINO|nr:unnamed protein product [Polarella glacialis]
MATEERIQQLERAAQAMTEELQNRQNGKNELTAEVQRLGRAAAGGAQPPAAAAAYRVQPLVDTRTIGKPDVFTGEEHKWNEWRVIFRACCAVANPDLVIGMHQAEGADAISVLIERIVGQLLNQLNSTFTGDFEDRLALRIGWAQSAIAPAPVPMGLSAFAKGGKGKGRSDGKGKTKGDGKGRSRSDGKGNTKSDGRSNSSGVKGHGQNLGPRCWGRGGRGHDRRECPGKSGGPLASMEQALSRLNQYHRLGVDPGATGPAPSAPASAASTSTAATTRIGSASSSTSGASWQIAALYSNGDSEQVSHPFAHLSLALNDPGTTMADGVDSVIGTALGANVTHGNADAEEVELNGFLRVGIDSRAATSVLPRGSLAGNPAHESPGGAVTSKTASRHCAADEGERPLVGKMPGAPQARTAKLRVAGVSMPFLSLAEMVDSVHRLVFDPEGERCVGHARHETSGDVAKFRRRDKVYEIDVHFDPRAQEVCPAEAAGPEPPKGETGQPGPVHEGVAEGSPARPARGPAAPQRRPSEPRMRCCASPAGLAAGSVSSAGACGCSLGGRHSSEGGATTLIGEGPKQRWFHASTVPAKGAQHPWSEKSWSKRLALAGHKRFVFRSDGEASLVAVKTRIAADLEEGHGVETAPEEDAVGDPPGNGLAEHAARDVKAKIRAVRAQVDDLRDASIGADHPAILSMVEHAATSSNLGRHGADGTSQGSRRKVGIEGEFLSGPHLGPTLRTDEVCAGAELSALRARTFKRLPIDQRGDKGMLNALVGKPWATVPANAAICEVPVAIEIRVCAGWGSSAAHADVAPAPPDPGDGHLRGEIEALLLSLGNSGRSEDSEKQRQAYAIGHERADGWNVDIAENAMAIPGAVVRRGGQRAFGPAAPGARGDGLAEKPTGWMSDNMEVLAEICRRCPNDTGIGPRRERSALVGWNTRAAERRDTLKTEFDGDLTGAPLDSEKVKTARRSEMDFMAPLGAWTYASGEDCHRELGSKPLSVRRADTDEGDSCRPDYRSLYIRLPDEDPMSQEAGKCGLVRVALYGARDAGRNFELTTSETAGFFHHGDDFALEGSRDDAEAIRDALSAKFVATDRGALGPAPTDLKGITRLNRALRWRSWRSQGGEAIQCELPESEAAEYRGACTRLGCLALDRPVVPPEGPAFLDIHSDADWAGCPIARRSTSSVVIKHGQHLIATASTTKIPIAMGSGKAEFYGCVRAASRAMGMQALCRGFGLELGFRAWSDLAAALGAMQRRGGGKVRHLETPTLWVQRALRDGRFQLSKVPGKSNPADLGTKCLNQAAMRFVAFVGSSAPRVPPRDARRGLLAREALSQGDTVMAGYEVRPVVAQGTDEAEAPAWHRSKYYKYPCRALLLHRRYEGFDLPRTSATIGVTRRGGGGLAAALGQVLGPGIKGYIFGGGEDTRDMPSVNGLVIADEAPLKPEVVTAFVRRLADSGRDPAAVGGGSASPTCAGKQCGRAVDAAATHSDLAASAQQQRLHATGGEAWEAAVGALRSTCEAAGVEWSIVNVGRLRGGGSATLSKHALGNIVYNVGGGLLGTDELEEESFDISNRGMEATCRGAKR